MSAPTLAERLARAGAQGIARAFAFGSEQAAAHLDADRVLAGSMSAFIELAARRYAFDRGATPKPGEPLKLLLAGYSGTRNTGADVRVEEMIRQFRHLFGDENLSLSILTIDPELSRGYFRTARQLHLPQVFPRFLFEAVHEHHGVVACEGSMFKSKFANALAVMMIGGLGLANAGNKLSIGYGGEAGAMDEVIREMVAKYCRESLLLLRNTESRHVLAELGLSAFAGTDTAWTFEPAPSATARALLESRGWDGRPILAIAPINPFWWPVRADVSKRLMLALTGANREAHYSSLYFHADNSDIRARQERYISSLASAVCAFIKKHDVFPVIVGMEQLDRGACEALAKAITSELPGVRAPCFVSDEHEMFELVAVLREARLLVSSRYHAIVTSMPALVPSIGITMDERIKNLMADRGQPELSLRVDQDGLASELLTRMHEVYANPEPTRDAIGACVVTNLARMGDMGARLVDYVRSRLPWFPFAPELGLETRGEGARDMPYDAFRHLPHLPRRVAELIQTHSAPRPATASSASEREPLTHKHPVRIRQGQQL